MNALATIDSDSATLPKNYEAARNALTATVRIDECKDWADKSMALASYARQVKDDSLQKMAMRIHGRAVRRAGELLAEIEPDPGTAGRKGIARTAPSQQSRKSAAESAGLSERQRKTALNVAGMSEDEFEREIESDNPPTVSALAKRGRKAKDPLEDKMRDIIGDAAMDDQEAYHAGIHISGAISDLLKQFDDAPSFERILATMSDRAKRDLRNNLSAVSEPLGELMHNLGE